MNNNYIDTDAIIKAAAERFEEKQKAGTLNGKGITIKHPRDRVKIKNTINNFSMAVAEAGKKAREMGCTTAYSTSIGWVGGHTPTK